MTPEQNINNENEQFLVEKEKERILSFKTICLIIICGIIAGIIWGYIAGNAFGIIGELTDTGGCGVTNFKVTNGYDIY